jgi:hypothetical protein
MPNLRLPGLWAEIWDSLVGTETHLGLDGLGIESWWGRDFWHRSRVALGHDINHSPTSTAKVKYRVELYIFFPSVTAWQVIGRTLSLLSSKHVVLHIQEQIL